MTEAVAGGTQRHTPVDGSHPSRLALLAIFALATLLRLWDLGRPYIGDHSWNEVVYGRTLRSGVAPYGPPLVPWLIAASQRLLGEVEWAARLPCFVLGLLALVVFFYLASELRERRTALAATFLAATAPAIVFFSRAVLLDGVMTTFGLAALLAALVHRRAGGRASFLLVWVLLAAAILAKYTAVLFVPALVWVLAGAPGQARNRAPWLVVVTLSILAAVPAVAWLAWATIAAPSSLGDANSVDYLWRSREWSLRAFYGAGTKLVTLLPVQLGPAVWYPGIALALCRAPALSRRALVERHAVPLLLILPWFAQLVFPVSWDANEYYSYPALFGLCLEIATVGVSMRDRLVASRPGASSRLVVAALVAFIGFSNLVAYRNTYHRSYFPWPMVSEVPFASALRVAAENVGRKPVLADQPQTLYYAGADPDFGTFLWWDASTAPMVEAIASGRFEYVVFAYPPPVDVVEAIVANPYERIAPAAWRRVRR